MHFEASYMYLVKENIYGMHCYYIPKGSYIWDVQLQH